MRRWQRILSLALCLLCLAGCTAAPVDTEAAPPAETAETAPPSAATPEPSFAPQLAESEQGRLRISELMSKNRATLAAWDGGFYDYIELENISAEPLSLEGWAISDGPGKKPQPLPELSLAAGERLLLFASSEGEAPELSFGLSEGDTVCLFAPSGALADELACPALEADEALQRSADGNSFITRWPSPGYPNDDAGYVSYAKSRSAAGPLVLNEIMTANPGHPARYGAEREDWAEIKNVSDAPVALEDFCLWDSQSESEPFHLPEGTLQSGESLVIVCGGDGEQDAPFSLSAAHDCLFLGSEAGLSDYCALHDLPVDGSFGRLDGEGFFYFTSPTPGRENAGGFRMVSAAPEALTPDGVYEGVDTLSVALLSQGEIYYSLDGSRPEPGGLRYEGPLSLNKTAALRAVAVEEGKAPSRVLTLTYLINEGHSLPVLSLCTDNPGSFRAMYNGAVKTMEVPGSLSLYENGGGFTQSCGVQMSGSGSLELPKKSMALMFRGCYGDGNLDYDVFDSGVSKYASLQLRAGEAYPTTVIKSDLFQSLCLDMSESALTQHSKFCAVYVNGAYFGLFCLKEKFSEQYYASLKNVSKSSVTLVKYPAAPDTPFYQELAVFTREADLTEPAQYEQFCQWIDVDSLIDWYLIEGLSGNSDIGGNLRLFRSSENGERWAFALYDLDWGFQTPSATFYNLRGSSYYHTGQIEELMNKAMQNPDFRDRILSRYAEVWDTSLSNERFLERIDEFQTLLQPEIARDRESWGGSEALWLMKLDDLRAFIRDNDVERLGVRSFCRMWGVSDEERASYFGW